MFFICSLQRMIVWMNLFENLALTVKKYYLSAYSFCVKIKIYLSNRATDGFVPINLQSVYGLSCLFKGGIGESREDVASKAKGGGNSEGAALLGIERDLWPETNVTGRARFNQVLERVLSQLVPACVAEQQFCVSFFQLDVINSTAKVKLIFNIFIISRLYNNNFSYIKCTLGYT